ncbi:CocE/NonD family hydrolase [Granulicella sp. 5B5]|uniref:CocE/NonD family hydrolase n=1 Tax=Granulicella sp. 5B5 TaxID=1617967 RepID=UPI0015F55DE9|nr:CocE/NonD family hydrolase [Granulicella sp. 5B5]QMV17813.1 CocE/NonD family hydrolase [Granulicella sp. 5B5]
MKVFRRVWAACVMVCAGASMAAAQQGSQMAEFLKAHYEKHEYRIPMRDGVKLYTQVYTPIAGEFEDKGPYPFLMTRTPYSCGNYDNDVVQPRVTGNMTMLKSGYILVCQDVRGRWESEGNWVEMTPPVYDAKTGHGIDESTDMSDSVDWLLKHISGNNGSVGIMGISYPGFYTAASIIDGNPAIKAASPQAPMINLFDGDDSYHGGAFMLAANHSFYAPFYRPQKNPLKVEPPNDFKFFTKDAYQYYLQMGTLAHLDSPAGGTNPLYHDQTIHDTYDAYWVARNMELHMTGVKAAVMFVGGWFDAEDLAGPVKGFHAVAKLSPDAAADTLVEGPWVHGGWARGTGASLGDIRFGSETSVFYQQNIEAPFFAHYLKDAAWTPLPKAYTFETGTDVWKKYDAWPPKQAATKTIYFQPNGGLSWTAPTESASKDSYVSDPAHPVPYVGYVSEADPPQRYMDDDQRFAATRPDVLVYETAPLTEDVTIVGPIKPRLKIASTGTDSDFDIKLIDVYPNDFEYPNEGADQGKHVTAAPPVMMGGYEMLVRGEPFRAKFRNSLAKPEPLVPGKITAVDYSMQDINHTFRKGHRIMVQVASSWFPLTDRNPQVFMDIAKAKPEDFHKATETVFHQADAASGIELMVMPAK